MPVKNNAMPDVITQIYPWKRVTVDAWKHGELPLWNPFSFSGTSHVGNYQSAVFSPINALFFMLPEIHAWSIMILLQPILSGLFMFLFLRRLRVSAASSVFGSIAFMFCGFIVVWLAYGTLAYAVLFLPLILYGIDTYITDNKKWAIVLAVLALGLSFLSGHFQMSLYVFMYAISFLVYHAIVTKNKRRTVIALFFIFLGVSIAAPQILPAFKSYTMAVRSSMFLKGEVIPWQYLITIFSPDFYGNPVTRNDWFGHYAEWASFIGVAPLFLALFAIWHNGKNQVIRYFSVMAVSILLLAFQTPLVDLLFALRIPVLSTSAASRIIVLVSFSLAVLSGFGLDALASAWEKTKRKKFAVWWLTSIIFIGIVWIILKFAHPLSPEKLAVAIRNSYLPTFLLAATLGVAGLGFFIPKRFRILLLYLLVLITAFDSYRFASKWMPFDPAGLVYPQLSVISTLQTLVRRDQARVFGNIGNEVGSAFGIPLIEGYDAVYQQRYGRLITATETGKTKEVNRSVVALNKHGKYTEDVLQLLGVRYYAHKKSDARLPWAYPFWELSQYDRIWEDEHFEIIENKKSLPRAFLASSYVVATGEESILEVLFESGIDKRETLVLEQTPAFEPEAGEGVATIASYLTGHIAIETASKVPKLLFLSDVYDSGWRADIDGKPVELYRADYDFRAVPVPAGTHTVRMRYAPREITVGFAIAGFATLVVVSFLIWKKRD